MFGIVALVWLVVTIVGLIVTIAENDETRETQLPHLQLMLNIVYVVVGFLMSIVTLAFGVRVYLLFREIRMHRKKV